MQTQKLYRKF